MERRQLLKGLAGLAACPLCLGAGHARAQHHWSYRDVNEWGGVCSTGGRQSPVDIVSITKNPQTPALQIGWGQASAIKNNGHTIEVACSGGMNRGGAQYQLVQFHFHHPSEHLINGQRFPMEAHFVHSGPGGLGVIGALMARGAKNETFARIVAAMPRREGQVGAAGINPRGLLPGSLRYYSYAGSLTTPACTENVTWMVLAQPIAVGADDVAAFGQVYAMNARPIKRRLTGVQSSP